MFTLSLCFVLFSNFTNTGCFLYPVSFSCVENLSWSIPKEQVIMMNNHYESPVKGRSGLILELKIQIIISQILIGYLIG